MSNLRSFHIPENLEKSIWTQLSILGCDPSSTTRIQENIIRLSDHFISANSKSPLSEKWAQIAYLAYYFPYNYLRAKAVCEEALRLNFFEGLTSAVDIGSGLGSLTLSLSESKADWHSFQSVDVSQEALELQKKLLSGDQKIFFRQDMPNEKIDLACMAYSWNEFSNDEKINFLKDCDKFEALLIIEPSTRTHARNLMELRAELIQKGFYAWGPCTHQEACPLLVHSKTDWCHDRIAVQKTRWLTDIEKQLPFKNETITFSYLLMRRTAPRLTPMRENDLIYVPARVIGDELIEKGKNRQALCRSSEREFLAWFPQRVKHNIYKYIHGELIFLQNDTQKKSNELRINETNILRAKN